MSTDKTREVRLSDCAMLINVDDGLAPAIVRSLSLLPVRCRHPRQGCERMLISRPLVVVVGGEPTADELSALEDVVVAVNAQLVVLRDIDVANAKKLDLHLKAALRAAKRSRLGAAPPA